VDPNGNIPLINQFDLTNWFYEELKFNVNHIYTKQIHSLLMSGGGLSPGSLNLVDKLRAGIGWIYLVKDKAKWDFKHNIKANLNSESFIFQHEGGYDWYEYSMPGNIFYGFIGRSAGFSAEALHFGAGYAEVTDPAHKDRGESWCPKVCIRYVNGSDNCQEFGSYFFNPEWAKTFYDDPLDYQAVEFGVQLFETTKGNLSYEAFKIFLTSNRLMLTKGSPETKDKWHKIKDDFYTQGYFDGPDTTKNSPTVNVLLLWPPFANY